MVYGQVRIVVCTWRYCKDLLIPTRLLIIHIRDLPQTKSSGGKSTLNRTLFDAIQQLHHLRQVWFESYHIKDSLPEPVSTFIQDVQELSLPYLHAICLCSPYSTTHSYMFTKGESGSENGRRCTKWDCETNVSARPVFDWTYECSKLEEPRVYNEEY
jgi:hypothetical protein